MCIGRVERIHRHTHCGACQSPSLREQLRVGSSRSGTSPWGGHAASLLYLELSKQAGWSVPGAEAGDMETALALVVGAEFRGSTASNPEAGGADRPRGRSRCRKPGVRRPLLAAGALGGDGGP